MGICCCIIGVGLSSLIYVFLIIFKLSTRLVSKQFLHYTTTQHLLSHPQPPQSLSQTISRGFVANRFQIYQQRQLDLIYIVYQKKQGNIQQMYQQILSRGFTDSKYSPPILYFKLSNLMLLGLYRVYRLTSTWMDDCVLRWNKFVKCYGDVFLDWGFGELRRLLKIAVNDHATVEEIKGVVYRMGVESAARQRFFGVGVVGKQRQPQQNKCQEQRKGMASLVDSIINPTLQQQQQQSQDFQSSSQNADEQQQNGQEVEDQHVAGKLAESIKDQIKKKLASSKKL